MLVIYFIIIKRLNLYRACEHRNTFIPIGFPSRSTAINQKHKTRSIVSHDHIQLSMHPI